MTTPHSEHERILQAVIVGELSADAPQVQEVIANCAECRERLDELREVEQLLGDEGAERQADLAAEQTEADRDSVARFVAARLEERPSGFRRQRTLRWGILLAAAALIVGLLLISTGNGEPPPKPIKMGQRISCDTPSGELAGSIAEFRWRAVEAPGITFRVRVWRRGTASGVPALLESPTLRETRWKPTQDELDGLPPAISWVVDMFQNREFLDSASADAWSRSR